MSATRLALLIAVIPAVATSTTSAGPAVLMVETFDSKNVCRVEVKSSISGKISVPVGEGKPAKIVDLSGSHHFQYDERPLPSEDPAGKKLVRGYRVFEFTRTISGLEQKAAIRPEVRRMVVLRSDKGKKAPFSPDGPLTFDEIDVVKNDLFCPTLVAGLLPTKAVETGAKWAASEAAVIDLTDLDKVEGGGLEVEFVGVIESNKKKYGKLTLSGSVKGMNEDGPSRQQLDGTIYFDLAANRLSYMKVNGVQELLGPNDQPTGKIEGTFTLTREASPNGEEFSDEALNKVDLKPTDDNTQLLYDNPDLGVKFLHPRRWRVGVVQGRQFTLDEPQGGGILFTVTPPGKTPTAAAFQSEVKEFLAKQKAKLAPIPEPKRWQAKPAIDRFDIDAELGNGRVRMGYAVLTTADGGVTVAARLPEKLVAELSPDLDRVLKTFSVTKKVVEK
jgi:hypothetical protein